MVLSCFYFEPLGGPYGGKVTLEVKYNPEKNAFSFFKRHMIKLVIAFIQMYIYFILQLLNISEMGCIWF